MPKAVTSTDLFLEQVVDRLDRLITLLEGQAPDGGKASPEPAASSKSTTSSSAPSRSSGKRRR